ncbi:MAG: hypothetical protein BRD48_08065 [Bacteroidetes bacterium QS_9_68_14]|nr:MAG: hypothetical protein BRD48_08065 [Bacteroidetes bacterium QS_9_68_14]
MLPQGSVRTRTARLHLAGRADSFSDAPLLTSLAFWGDPSSGAMDDRTRSLLGKSQQYLRSAAVLLEVGDYDSCVSRAYFAMFYAARAALLTTGTSVRNRRSVRSAFVERFVDGGRFPQHAAEVLHHAHDLQETADYAQQPVVEETDAEKVLSEAEAFIGSIDVLAQPRRSERARQSRAPSSSSPNAAEASAARTEPETSGDAANPGSEANDSEDSSPASKPGTDEDARAESTSST